MYFAVIFTQPFSFDARRGREGPTSSIVLWLGELHSDALVLVHFGFGRVASLEFSRAFQSREESLKRLRRIATLERFGSSVATRRELEMPLTQR